MAKKATTTEQASNRIVFGVRAIAEQIDLDERRTYRLLKAGAIPGRKIEGQWASTTEALERFRAELA